MSRDGVVVLGDVMTDVVARVDRPLAPASDTPAAIRMRRGGSAANTAAWLGHLGVPVTFVGCVGDDAAGSDAAAALRAAGVEPALHVAPDGVATGACVVLIDAAGERTMLPDAGANALLPEQPLPGGAHLHVSGYSLLRAGSRPAARAALLAAREAGMTTSVDPASAAPLAEVGAAAFRDLVRGATTIVVTPDEAEVLTGARDPDAVVLELLRDHAEVVLKLGGDGARWASAEGGHAAVPAAPPDGPVVDHTGAGDAFTAAWLAARRAGRMPDAALAAACALAARVVTREGARP
ncbi:MAG TPA: carbohydrate kinase family protein [Miltoncostaeaceae bacterium]|nr:carbohydrate kinase family protein [Miltoncostaeaceae bacterium]